MNCDLCNKPAVVHEVTVKNGVKKEVHLCEEHAAESGIAMPGHQPINQLLTQFVCSTPQSSGSGSGAARSGRGSQKRSCTECGLTYSKFRKTGILGCPNCYEVFGEQLAPLIERAQNSGSHHTGKAPRRSGKSIDRQLQRQRLIRQLDEAIGAEQYERAAQIRDMLNELAPDDVEAESGTEKGGSGS